MSEWTDEDLAEWWNERAAIQHFDGGLDRREAEKRAYFAIKKEFGRVPKVVVDWMRKVLKEVAGDRGETND